MCDIPTNRGRQAQKQDRVYDLDDQSGDEEIG